MWLFCLAAAATKFSGKLDSAPLNCVSSSLELIAWNDKRFIDILQILNWKIKANQLLLCALVSLRLVLQKTNQVPYSVTMQWRGFKLVLNRQKATPTLFGIINHLQLTNHSSTLQEKSVSYARVNQCSSTDRTPAGVLIRCALAYVLVLPDVDFTCIEIHNSMETALFANIMPITIFLNL